MEKDFVSDWIKPIEPHLSRKLGLVLIDPIHFNWDVCKACKDAEPKIYTYRVNTDAHNDIIILLFFPSSFRPIWLVQ
jgi:hypothetical protein